MKTITFYSYKGGVGRSLSLANIAVRLSEIGKKVCVIDFDLEAPGLHFKFDKFLKNKKIENGIVDYISELCLNKQIPKSILPYVIDFEIGKQFNNSIQFIPAGNSLKSEYWSKLNRIDWYSLFYEADSIGIDFFLNMKSLIEREINPDVLLIDSRTGITDISSMSMSILADELVMLAANNKENKDGLKMVIESLYKMDNHISGKPPKIYLVLSRIPAPIDRLEIRRENDMKDSFLREINDSLLAVNDSMLLKEIFLLHSDRDLEVIESLKIDHYLNPDYQEENGSFSPIGKDYTKLFNSITADLLDKEDLEKFTRIKKAELLLNQAKSEKNSYRKEKILKEILDMDEKVEEAYLLLGQNYLIGQQYEEAEKILKKLLDINSSNIDALFGKAVLHYKKEQYEEAENTLKEILNLEPSNNRAIGELGGVYSLQNKNELALKMYKQKLELDPNNSSNYNNYADSLRKAKRLEEALTLTYRGIEVNPKDPYLYSTLAEINAEMNNMDEFYRNIELAIALDFPVETFLDSEDIYVRLKNDKKFRIILDKYNIEYES